MDEAECYGSSLSLQSENILMYGMIPEILKGLSRRVRNDYEISYENIDIRKGIFCDKKVYNLYVDVTVSRKRDGKDYVEKNSKVLLASIPRMDEDGIFTLDNLRYYIVNRQRLMHNVPICEANYTKGYRSVRCMLRAENMESLESVQLTLKRKTKSTNRIMISTKDKDSSAIDVIGYIKQLLHSDPCKHGSSWELVFTQTLDLFRCSKTVKTVILSMMTNIEEVSEVKELIPFAIDNNNGYPHAFTVGEFTLTSVYICICQALIKMVRVECREIEPDDKDDFCNKIVDRYPNIMGKLIRKYISKLGSNAVNGNSNVPKIHGKLIDAIKNDKWKVVDKYNDELKISRRLDFIGRIGIQSALVEVIALAGSHTSDVSYEEKYNARMLHPSQEGYMCIVRTTDDKNAGLRNYLASDCYVSNSMSLSRPEEYRNVGDNDIEYLRFRYISNIIECKKEPPSTMKETTKMTKKGDSIIWTHNNITVVVGFLDNVISVLERIKKFEDKYLSWSIHDGVLESRCYYGRFMSKNVSSLYGECFIDSREMKRVQKSITKQASKFSKMIYDIPHKNMMPVPRAMITAKILQKSISDVPPDNNFIPDYVHSCYSQKPLVVTSEYSKELYGCNVVVCYTTLKGGGVEDGIVINKSSIERGLFSVIQRSTLKWSKENSRDITVIKLYIKVSKGDLVKQGTIVALIKCTEKSVLKSYKLRHKKPSVFRVENIETEFEKNPNNKLVQSSDLISVSVSMVRYKKLDEADKICTRYGQKGVITDVKPAEDMPYIVDSDFVCSSSNNPSFGPDIDIIVSPMSIFSRCTISQELSSNLGVHTLANGYRVSTNKSSGVFMGNNRGDEEEVDVESLSQKRVLIADGITGQIRQERVAVGIEYYMILNHISDMKVRSKKEVRRDPITGLNEGSSSDTCIKYNWQELIALLHSDSYKLVSNIFNDSGSNGKYPYCKRCDRCVDGPSGICEYCNTNVSTSLSVSKPFMVAKAVMESIGGDIIIRAEQKD